MTRSRTPILSVLLALALIVYGAAYSSSAHAQETESAPAEAFTPPPPQDLAHIYSPDYCDFRAGFPTEPLMETKCDGGENRDQCYDRAGFVQTFGLDSTVSLTATCNPIDADVKERYDEEVMIKTLEAMTDDNVVQTYSTSFKRDEQGRYKVAGLIGEGMVGVTPSIYIMQMWLGDRSAMVIESQLIGEQFEESDALFRDLLMNIRYKGDDEESTASAPADEDNED
ncbi:MAG: hypothetical protein ACK4VI_02680 [Alphaproteobacteria bacterium]